MPHDQTDANVKATPPEVPAGVVAQLAFDFFRQLSTLSLAAAGGAITLTQTALAESLYQGMVVAGSVGLFLAALFALQAQQILVERLAAETEILRPPETLLNKLQMKRTAATERRMVYISFGLFGLGAGLVLASLLLEYAAV